MKTGLAFLAAALSLATAKPWSKVGVIDGEKASQGALTLNVVLHVVKSDIKILLGYSLFT